MPREPWQPKASTEPVGIEQRSPGANRQRSLRQELRDADGFSTKALTLAVLGSVVGTVLATAAGTGPWGSLAGATVAPVTTTVFTTKRTGESGRVRTAAIVILSLTAVVITWAGISAAETARGTPLIPGADRTFTLPMLNQRDIETARQKTSAGMDLVPDNLDCGTVAIGTEAACPALTITSTGAAPLHLARLKITGADAADFDAEPQCTDRSLSFRETCEVTVTFTPSEQGNRAATLVVYPGDPSEAQEEKVRLAGAGKATGDCIEGFVWRLVDPSDHVCVTRETRQQVLEDNARAASRRSPTGGIYGPDTCLEGYVWREAIPGDHVCVRPESRDQAQRDNAEAASRRASKLRALSHRSTSLGICGASATAVADQLPVSSATPAVSAAPWQPVEP